MVDRPRSRSPLRAKEDGEDDVPEIEDTGRMASDQESGFVLCCSLAAARQATADGERRMEFGGLRSSELAMCVDFACELLTANSKIQGISFADCALDETEIRKLSHALAGSTSEELKKGKGVGAIGAATLQCLGISKNPGVAAAAWHDLFAVLPQRLTWIDFGDNKLDDVALAPLLKGLSGREELDKLFLDGNAMSDLSVLSTALPDTGVTQLDLGDNAIGDEGLKKLVSNLPETVVMVLVLGTNPLGPRSAERLMRSLPKTSVDTLYLDKTGCDDTSLEALGSVLQESKLSELHLDNTKITDAGVRALLPHVSVSQITYLDVSGCNVSDNTIKALEEAVALVRGGEDDGDEEAGKEGDEDKDEEGGEEEEQEPFPVGTEVEAHGLSVAALNGARGRVTGRQGERVRIEFGSDIGEKALKDANLRLVQAAAH